MTFNDTEGYRIQSIAILDCKICSKITVAHVTLPKAVLITVKIFAVWGQYSIILITINIWFWFGFAGPGF